MEELPKLLASRRAHKAHLTKLRQKINDTAEGTIADKRNCTTQVSRGAVKAKETNPQRT